MHTCVVVNQAVAAQNLAVDALETYCASADFNDNKGPCKPDKSLAPKLTQALRNMQDIVSQVQAVTGDPAPQKAVLQGIGGLPDLGSALGLIQLALSVLSSLLVGLKTNPKYSGIVSSVESAIASLQSAHDEVVTKEELESLRTKPQW
jgi:hypothetical protein